MTKAYDVSMAGERIGSVTVREDGLYVHFFCRCSLSGEVMFQLIMRNLEGDQNLGLLVPADGGFGLEKRLPKKRVGQGSLEFFLRPRHEPMNEHFVPIRADTPFAYLGRLEQAVMAVRDGQIGVLLPSEK